MVFTYSLPNLSTPTKKKPVNREKKSAGNSPALERKRRITKEVSVMGWIEDIHGAVLLVKQKRGRKLWSLPGGKIESGESLEQGLIREIKEEISLGVKHCRFIELLDRPDKSNLTLLYRVVVHPGASPVAQRSEIIEIQFRTTLPRDATPSLKHFWRVMRAGNSSHR